MASWQADQARHAACQKHLFHGCEKSATEIIIIIIKSLIPLLINNLKSFYKWIPKSKVY